MRRRIFGTVICVFAASTLLTAQTYTVKTFAGVAPPKLPSLANNLFLNAPDAVASDSKGNTFITDTTGHRVWKIDANGNPSVVIGNGGLPCAVYDPVNNPAPSSPCTSSGGGGGPMTMGKPANTQPIGIPDGLAVDSSGNLFIADRSRHRIFEVDTTGVVTLIAGSTNNGRSGTTGDGRAAVKAELDGPREISFDSAGNLFIADTGNSRIRKIAADSSGKISGNSIITTVAGGSVLEKNVNTGVLGVTTTQVTTSCSYLDPQQLLVNCGDGGLATQAMLNGPEGVVVDANGTIYIADTGNNRIRMVCTQSVNGLCSGAKTGSITAIAGRDLTLQERGLDQNGQPIKSPSGTGNISAASAPYPNSCPKPTPGGSPCASAGDGRSPITALLAAPAQLSLDANGNLIIADRSNNRVRLLNLSASSIQTVAGTGTSGNGGDGSTASLGTLSNPSGVTVDAAGNVLFTDRGNNRIRIVNASGLLNAFAGANRFNGDQGALTALLNAPTGIARDAAGNIYFADSGNQIIRKIDASGNVITIAGTAGSSCTFSTAPPFSQVCGDGGPASSAKFNNPSGIAVDPTGTVIYIADTANNRIRKIVSGQINTVAGGCTDGWGPGGSIPVSTAGGFLCPSSAQDGMSALFYKLNLNGNNPGNTSTSVYQTTYQSSNGSPIASTTIYTICTAANGICIDVNSLGNNVRRVAPVALDGAGNLYFSDISNSVVRVMTTDGTVHTVVGTFQLPGSAGDGGPATSALTNNVTGLAVSADGKYVFFSETSACDVRMVYGGVVYPVAGEPTQTGGPDSESTTLPAYDYRLLNPQGLVLQEVDNADGSVDLTKTALIIADSGGNAVRKVNLSTLIMTRVAGNLSFTGDNFAPDFFGEGVAGNLAQFNYPTGVVVDTNGTVYITDSANGVIRTASLPSK
jgi:sugar lactone lactonase YvrE